MSKDGTIVGLGLTVIDLLCVVEEYPRVDTKQDVTESRVQVGGPVPTALTQLVKFGHQCRLISRWGDDVFGHAIEADLSQTRTAHSSDCRQSGLTTGHSQVWIERPTGKRTSITQRPCSDRLRLTDDERTALVHAGVLHLDGWPEAIAKEAADIVKTAGGQVALDTGSPKPGIDELLPLADIVNAPRRFIEETFHTSDLLVGAHRIAEFGPRYVTVTAGGRGAVMVSRKQAWRVPALPLPRVVDTNGAGDVFTAGLIHGVLCDWTPPQTLSFASAVAGLKCGALGNRSALSDQGTAQQSAEQVVAVEIRH